jgi:hypothetical protein
MKRFIIALTIMIGSIFIFMFDGFSNIKSRYDYTSMKPRIFVYNSDFGLIRFADTEEEIPIYMKHKMDLICEIDSVKYYLVD